MKMNGGEVDVRMMSMSAFVALAVSRGVWVAAHSLDDGQGSTHDAQRASMAKRASRHNRGDAVMKLLQLLQESGVRVAES